MAATTMYDDTWLVVPLYNEGEVIRQVIADARPTEADVEAGEPTPT